MKKIVYTLVFCCICCMLVINIPVAVATNYTVDISSYDAFRSATMGNGYDIDNAYGVQCWDGAALLWQQLGRGLSTGDTGGAHGCWDVAWAREANAGSDFNLIYNFSDVKRGDIVVMLNTSENSFGHICFADEDYNGTNALKIYGQNQAGTKAFNVIRHGSIGQYFLGAFRLKRWQINPPTNVWMNPSMNQTVYIGDSLTFTYGADQTCDYYLHVCVAGTSNDDCRQVSSSGTATYTFNNLGTYSVWVGAANSRGSKASNSINVTVQEKTGDLQISGRLDGVMSSTTDGYATFDVYITQDNATTRAAQNVTTFNGSYKLGTEYEIKNIQTVNEKNNDGVYMGALQGTISSTGETKVVLAFSSPGIATHEWTEGMVVPGNLDRDTLDVEYKHTFTQQARTAPGDGWTMIQEGPVQYENVGGQYESDNELPTSATRVQIGYYYYHYCNNGVKANYYWKDYLPIRHAIPMANSMNNFTAEEKGTDGDGSGRKYYYLTHTQGQYVGAIAKCGSSGSNIYYRGYVYQDKAEYRINTYQKVGEWTTAYDSSASSVSVRWRLKENVDTEYKGLQLNFVVDGNSVDSLDGVAGLDVYINGEKKADNSTTFKAFFPGEFAYEIQLRNIADDKLYKQIEGGDLNGVVTEDLKTLTLYFVTGVEAGENWKEIPADLLPYLDENTEVEYRHTYKQNARTSPGEGWEMIEQGAVQYENDGAQYESDNELETSATRALVGYYYFHWCNESELANYYQKDYLPIKHTVAMQTVAENYTVQEKGTDGDGSGRKYYFLIQKNGNPALCTTNGSKIWYRGGIYQNKKAYQINTYQKVGDWTTELDTNATSVEYRIRKKQYSVIFYYGESTFVIDQMSKTAGEDIVLPTVEPVRDLYEFTEWNTANDGTGESYLPGDVYNKDESVVLYACWKEVASFELPSALRTIEEEAFAGINAVIVRIPSTCAEIKSRAFLNCSSLRKIYISGSTSQISVDAFDGCVNLVICAPAGSTAIKVAKYNDIPYIETEIP